MTKRSESAGNHSRPTMRSITPFLKIKLTPSLREATGAWVDRFNRERLAMSADPVIEGDALHIDCSDLGNFLRLVSTAEASALDVHRLRHRPEIDRGFD